MLLFRFSETVVIWSALEQIKAVNFFSILLRSPALSAKYPVKCSEQQGFFVFVFDEQTDKSGRIDPVDMNEVKGFSFFQQCKVSLGKLKQFHHAWTSGPDIGDQGSDFIYLLVGDLGFRYWGVCNHVKYRYLISQCNSLCMTLNKIPVLRKNPRRIPTV